MTISNLSRTLFSSAFAASLFVTWVPNVAQAVPTQREIEEVFEIRVLAEAGWTYPAIEEMLKTRKEAAARLRAGTKENDLSNTQGMEIANRPAVVLR
jgi:hypothetical protein